MNKKTITGKITNVIYKNGDYHICKIETNDNQTCTISINHNVIKPGLVANFTGSFVKNKYGDQFKCDYFIEKIPNTKDGFIAYLQSGSFKGVGAVTAKKIADFLGENPLEKLKEDIDIILSVPKIKKDILESIKETWVSNSVKTEITILLQQYGITGASVDKIYKKFGAASINVVTNNPYKLIYYVKGIGFKLADKIALSIGIEKDSEIRLVECIKYVVDNNSSYGSCYLTEKQVIDNIIDLIGDIDSELIKKTLLSTDNIIKLTLNDEVRYYSKDIYKAENFVLLSLKSMLNIVFEADVYNLVDDSSLSDEQKLAVIGALSNKISILTGGPGCGKTYTTKTIVNTLIDMNKCFAICAPTGKAAIRSTEVIGHKAKTIHRLLEIDPESGDFIHNINNKLKYDFIIIEESSMIDIKLMSNLLEAIDDNTQLLFVGDQDQLPPVGAGSPFKDMIQSGLIPTYRLNKIFRQALTSKIITYAHSINKGQDVYIESPILEPRLWQSTTDCLFIDSEFSNNLRCMDKKSTLYYGKEMDIIFTIKRLYSETIKKYRGYDDIQILIPKRIGSFGVNTVNTIIQDLVNPIENFSQQIIIKGDKFFRLNDKVIHTQNNYNLGGGVFNGEIGKITKIDIPNSKCVVSYPNKDVTYSKSDMVDLELAFAITIHKSQGSEFDCVILPILNEYGIMLERSLIYTALTRAKKLAIFLGQRQPLIKAIKTVNTNKRQTSLCELLVNESVNVSI